MAKKIFFGNYKGGVGKTTSVFSVAHKMAKPDLKVLLVDIDPQSSLSEICVRNTKNTMLDKIPSDELLNYIFDLSIRKIKQQLSSSLSFDYSKLIHKCKEDNVYFIPSSLHYEETLGLDELSMKMTNTIDYFSIFPKFLDGLDKEEKFDYILIDCPPTSNIITQSAFLMSDYYVIPTIEDGISTNGVLHYIQTVNRTYDKYCSPGNDDYLLYKHYFGSKPKLLGIFYTLLRGQVDYGQISSKFQRELEKLYEDNKEQLESEINIFQNYTDNYIDIARDIADGKVSGKVHDKDSYKAITEEMLEKIKKLEGGS